jgi:hypothetical protein
MRLGRRDDREMRHEVTVRRGHTVAAKVILLVGLVLFTIFWLLLAPGSAAATF